MNTSFSAVSRHPVARNGALRTIGSVNDMDELAAHMVGASLRPGVILNVQGSNLTVTINRDPISHHFSLLFYLLALRAGCKPTETSRMGLKRHVTFL